MSLKQSEKKTLKKREIIDLQNGLNHISTLNSDTQYPVYDLGAEVHACMGRTFKRLQPIVETLVDEQKAEDEEIKTLKRDREAALKGLDGVAKTEKETEFDALEKEIRDKRKKRVEEELEVSLFRFKWSDVKYKGQTPPPDVMSCLDPLIDWPAETAAKE